MKNVKTKNIISMLLNLLTFVLVLYSILWFFRPSSTGAGNMAVAGTNCFKFFTNDSNILAGIAALIMVPFNIKSIAAGEDKIPRWAITLKMVGTVAVTLTMMVVLLFLGPTQGYAKMFSGVCLPLHLICPLLCIISFCFFERGEVFSKKDMLWGIVPTLVYGTVYLFCVIVFKIWVDFYGFNMGGMWYVSIVVVPAVSYLFALCLRALRRA